MFNKFNYIICLQIESVEGGGFQRSCIQDGSPMCDSTQSNMFKDALGIKEDVLQCCDDVDLCNDARSLTVTSLSQLLVISLGLTAYNYLFYQEYFETF